MLQVNDISKNFGDFKAINNLSFEVKVGDVMGFLGPNGAGKTTSMRVITGTLNLIKEVWSSIVRILMKIQYLQNQ